MTNTCSLSMHRAPFCPSCGQLSSHWSEYRETEGDGPIITNALVRLSWVCDACHFDVTVNATRQTDETAVAESVG